MSSSQDIVLYQGKELIEFYRNNPCIAAWDLLRVDLAPIQRLMFEDMWFKNYVIGICGRGGGKTYMLGTLAALSCMLYPGNRVGLLSGSYRQAKMIFSEVEKIYGMSPIMREACEKKPVKATDQCYLKFKSVGGKPSSYIEAMPLGDSGGKIRGSRFYWIFIDELAQVPDKIIDMVIRPMAATVANPMERVRYLEQQKRLIAEGLATEHDFDQTAVNKMIMTSSGYYKFNHMWRRMRDYWKQIEIAEHEGKVSQYAVWQIPYWNLPEGFLDSNSVEEARRTMADHEFSMEYEAAMVSDSSGFFKASLVDACSVNSGFQIETVGDSESRYIVGVDPNQGGKTSSCGVVVVKLGNTNKLVYANALQEKTTQQLTSFVQEICNDYNIVRIFMDKGGGGKAIMDLLEEGYNDCEPIIDRTDKDKVDRKGRHILEMISFAPAWISDANFSTLSLLESKKLKFPEPPVSAGEDAAGKVYLDAYDAIDNLKRQLLCIVVSETKSGALHFDTPVKGQRKDLYSAFILAGYGARLLEMECEDVDDSHILYSAGGLTRPRGMGAGWSPYLHRGMPNQRSSLSKALLEKPK